LESKITLEPLTEFETKYDISEDKLTQFKNIFRSLEGLESFTFAEGPDSYYTPTNSSIEARFARYRKAAHELEQTAWLTFKKASGKYNYKRIEPNIFVTKTPIEDIESMLEMHSYKFDFTIYKTCHIYKFEDATLVFYTVTDDLGKINSFIEIELDEETIQNLSEEEAWDVIRKYEAHLTTLGITYKNRKRLALYDMYKK
jgi:adenylate cyclase class IV